MTLYDRIGHGYAARRQEDVYVMERIMTALGDAETVVNVGAGTGSYEPGDRHVIAVEPSAVMAAQRPTGRPATRGVAGALPLHDKSVDAAMSVLSIHHWPDQAKGIAEMFRVARKSVTIVTIDPEVSGRMWLMAEYLHEVRDLDLEIFPPPSLIAGWFEGPAEVDVIHSHRDSKDHNLLSFWAHPERVLDAEARAVTSGFARQPAEVVERVVSGVSADLRSGAWDGRHGELRSLSEFDAGLRIVHATLD